MLATFLNESKKTEKFISLQQFVDGFYGAAVLEGRPLGNLIRNKTSVSGKLGFSPRIVRGSDWAVLLCLGRSFFEDRILQDITLYANENANIREAYHVLVTGMEDTTKNRKFMARQLRIAENILARCRDIDDVKSAMNRMESGNTAWRDTEE